MWQTWFSIDLWKRILVALLLGIVVGAVWGEGAASIRWVGDLFMRSINMVVVPLVFFTLVSGIIAMGDPKKLGSLGAKTLALYMFTTVCAITIGLSLAVITKPGVGIDLSGAVPGVVQEAMPLSERLISIVPRNPVAALAEGNILAIIFFALMFGVATMVSGEKARPVATLMHAGSEVMLKITGWVMEIAPFGVFALIAWVSGTQGVAALLDVVGLALTVLLGCVLHVVITHGAIMKFLVKVPPLRFLSGAKDAMLVAFSTSSSSATMPVTLSVAEKNLGVSPIVATTVIPLGATINMDGTALYVGIVTVFAAQAFGIDLVGLDYLLIIGATALVSIGTAAVPGASVFLMAAVMGAIGLSPEQIATVVGFIIPFDRPLDMTRTCVNVTGDLAVSTAVANWEGDLDKEVLVGPNPV
ncbi:MAG: dicarboxylate/amino acid:cation symporter [Pseudohongiellaceae bacterium]|nr:dicarboxylate/amino acid:cation symporter [Pseudohongiellaceae bacterium]